MSRDISPILDGWEYDPDRVSVRIIQGTDGREKIQLRLDLGLLQLEIDGRPDGQRPEGCESWLDYYERKQRAHDAAHPDAARFLLEADDCSRLLREGIQYYHRYLSFWHLERYELCARDTNRNLRLFQFVREHARLERDKLQFEQWRPYVTMMHARAVATPFVELRDYETAIKAIDAGIAAIRSFLEEYRQADKADQCAELAHLARWREEIAAKLPRRQTAARKPDRVQRLQKRLERAIAEERFEEAVRLRDEIRRLTELPAPPRIDESL